MEDGRWKTSISLARLKEGGVVIHSDTDGRRCVGLDASIIDGKISIRPPASFKIFIGKQFLQQASLLLLIRLPLLFFQQLFFRAPLFELNVCSNCEEAKYCFRSNILIYIQRFSLIYISFVFAVDKFI